MSCTLATVVTEFLDRPGLASSTIRSYTSVFMPLLRQYGHWPIELLDRNYLQEYLNDLQHLSYQTHRRHQTTLQALLNYAVEQQYLTSNPIAHLKQRRPDPGKGEYRTDQTIRYLTPAQLKLLCKSSAHDPRMDTLIRLLHRSGARIAEVLALDVDQIDFKQRRFQVMGKGSKTRWCFYSTDVNPSLNTYLKYYRHASHPALFTAQQPITKQVSRLSYRTAYQGWQQIITPHKTLAGCRLHDLRHTFATERVGLMGIEELRALMGHQNIQTTLRYQKVTSQRAETVAQKALNMLIQTDS